MFNNSGILGPTIALFSSNLIIDNKSIISTSGFGCAGS